MRWMISRGLSERRSLRVIGMSASALRYQPRADRNGLLRERIIALAQRHRRYGAGMIYLKLRQAGELVNHKRIERLYALEKLQVRRRRRKKIPVSERQPLIRPGSPNEVWSGDFVFDRIASGRTLKCLVIVDDATHEAVAIVVEHCMGGNYLTRVFGRCLLAARPTCCDSDKQREGIHGQSNADVGHSERCGAATDRAGKAQPECLRRIVQRPAARRMSERALVRDPCASPIDHRDVAARVQPRKTEESPRRADARRVCKAFDRKSDYNPGKTLNLPATQIGGDVVPDRPRAETRICFSDHVARRAES